MSTRHPARRIFHPERPGLFVLVLMGVLSGAVQAAEFTLAAGAGYRRPLAELAGAYEKASGNKVTQIYGHLGQVVAQAREGETVSVVCADRAVIEPAEGLSYASFVRLGAGRLVVAFRKGIELKTAADIAAPTIARIAIPDQVNAVYGKAGRQYLDRAGLAATVDSRLLAVSTVPQVTSYVVSGEVDAGFINATDALGAVAGIGGFVDVDPKYYDPVEIACGILTRAADMPAVAGFAAFLGTEEARAIVKRHGL